MRWIITIDHHGGCLGAGENIDGIPWQGTPDQAATLPMEFRLYHAGAIFSLKAVAATLTRIGGTVSSR